jgi:hypothetical protein
VYNYGMNTQKKHVRRSVQIGFVYCFAKSGSIVEVKAPSEVVLGGKTVKGFAVRRIDNGKEFFSPRGALLPLSALQD